jgi:hypothetical protein
VQGWASATARSHCRFSSIYTGAETWKDVNMERWKHFPHRKVMYSGKTCSKQEHVGWVEEASQAATETRTKTHHTTFPIWLIVNLSLPENTPVTLPFTGSSLSGRFGRIKACGAGIKRGKKIHFESVET